MGVTNQSLLGPTSWDRNCTWYCLDDQELEAQRPRVKPNSTASKTEGSDKWYYAILRNQCLLYSSSEKLSYESDSKYKDSC